MSRGVGNMENPSTTWFWKDWDYDTSRLTLAEKGMWVDLIGAASRAPLLGEWTGPMSSLMGYGETLESVWRMLQGLGSKKIAVIEVMIGGRMVALTPENFTEWEAFKPGEMTPLKVVCRRLVRQRERNEKTLARVDAARGKKGVKGNSSVTERGLKRNGNVTEALLNADSSVTDALPDTVTTRARTSPISSSYEEDYKSSVDGEKKNTSTLVDEAFVAEMVDTFGALGVDVRKEALLAKVWIDGKPGRKFTRRFFRDTWLKNEARKAAISKMSPRAALEAARAAGEPTGERPCPDFNGTFDEDD